MHISIRTLAGDLPLSGLDPAAPIAHALQALAGAAQQAGIDELPSRLVFKGRALADDTLSAAGVSDGDSLVGLPRREPRQPRSQTEPGPSPDEATIMAVTSEEARVRGLPTEAQPAAAQPSRRRATAMQDAIGAELLGLLEQAVPGFVPASLGLDGPQAGGEAAPLQVPEPNAEYVTRLGDMGFPEPVARRALLLTRNRLDAATEWCLMHSDDADASDPPTEDQLRRVYGHRSMAARAMPVAMQPADPALVLQLQEMGFPEEMARMALQRYGNDVEMACQALLSAGALGRDAGAGDGHAAAEEGHDALAGTSDDAGAHDGMDLSGDGASDAGASHEYHSDHSGDSVPAHSGHDDSDDGHHDHEDDDESDDDEEGDDDDDGEHGGDGTDGEGINVPRPAEDDYEDGLQDMDMMPGDMGIGDMNYFDGMEGFGIQELLERVGSENEMEFMEDLQQSPQMIDAIQMMLSDPSSYAPLVEHPELAPYMRALRRMVGMEDSNPEGISPATTQEGPPSEDQPAAPEDGA